MATHEFKFSVGEIVYKASEVYERKKTPNPYKVKEIILGKNREKYHLDDDTQHTDLELMSFDEMKVNLGLK